MNIGIIIIDTIIGIVPDVVQKSIQMLLLVGIVEFILDIN